MKILIYSDNKWVIESIEKYIDFDYELLENVDFRDMLCLEQLITPQATRTSEWKYI